MIWGDAGGDTITGGAGYDWIWGGPGPDTIDGGADDDMIYSGDFSLLYGPYDQPYDGVGYNPDWPDMWDTGGRGNNTVDGHEEPLGGGGYGGPAGGMGGGATGLGNSFQGAAGTPVNVAAPGVLGNSSGKRAEVYQPPTYGQFTLNEDGSFAYTPDADFTGLDMFLFVAVDIATNQESAPIPIILQIEGGSGGGEQPPVAYEDFVTAPMDGGASTGALEYFENADTVDLVVDASHGTLVLNSDGSYTYTPVAGFEGVDSFQYVAIDSATNQQSSPATVTILVYSTQPRAASDRYALHISEGSLVVGGFGVMANDAWVDTVQKTLGPFHGTATLNPDGTFTYVPNSGYLGSDTFFYRATNTATGQQTGSVMVRIDVGEIAPLADFYSTLVNTPVSASAPGVLGNDEWAAWPYAWSGVSDGTLTFQNDGSFNYSPNSGFTGLDSFWYRAVDPVTLEYADPTPVRIWVVSPQAGPANIEYTTTASTSIQVNNVAQGLLANDSWATEVQLVDGAGPAHGTVFLSLFDGRYSGGFQYGPQVGYLGDDSFQYIAFNAATGQSALRVATIHVVQSPPPGEPDPPIANDDFFYNSWYQIEGWVWANDSNTNRYEVLSSPSHGTLEVRQDEGMFLYTANEEYYQGYDSFQYRALRTGSGGAILAYSQPATVTLYLGSLDPLALDRQAIQSNEQALIMSQLLVIGDAAISRWVGAGLSEAARARLADVRFVIADLPGSLLGGMTDDGRIMIDVNAAGYGWFVDATPGEDSEFQSNGKPSERRAAPGSAAADDVDLLTVVMHELGHLLGLDHVRGGNDGNIMADSLDLGIRRLPTRHDANLADIVFGQSWSSRRRRAF